MLRHPCGHRRRPARRALQAETLMAIIVGGIGTSHTPTIGFALDTHKQRQCVGADLQGLQAGSGMARREATRRAAFHLQRSRHFVLFRPLFALRAGRRRASSGWRTRAAARAAAGRSRGIRPCAPHRQRLVADEFDLSFFQSKGLDHGCFSPLSCCGRTSLPGPAFNRSSPGGGAWNFRFPRRSRCFKLGQVAAQGHREFSRRYQGCHRGHRGFVAPGARRALRLQ